MNLLEQVKNRFNISNILKELLLRVKKLESGSSTGDFIPLTGTEEGKPVTGDINFEMVSKLIFKNLDNNPFVKIGYNPDTDETGLWYDNGVDAITRFSINNGSISCYLGDSQIEIRAEKGIWFSQDVSNILPENKLIYAQRSYVDKANSYSTDETLTGGTWIDGKPIYRKVSGINIPTVNPEYINLSSYFPNLKNLIKATSIIDLTNDDGRKMFGNTFETYCISFDFNDNYVSMHCINFDQTPNEKLGVADKITVILEYTKTTD
jgi:hypothetical protein